MPYKTIHMPHVELHQDSMGRLYFDKCTTDEQHMFAPVPEGDDRPRCRKYLDNPEVLGYFVGKRGTFSIRIEFQPEEG